MLCRPDPSQDVMPINDTAPAQPTLSASIPPTPVTPPSVPRQIISNARGGFPQMEIVEHPSPKKSQHRQQTESSSGPRSAMNASVSLVMRNVAEKLGNVSTPCVYLPQVVS
jgi:nitrous oxide reductase accessory protein NosL